MPWELSRVMRGVPLAREVWKAVQVTWLACHSGNAQGDIQSSGWPRTDGHIDCCAEERVSSAGRSLPNTQPNTGNSRNTLESLQCHIATTRARCTFTAGNQPSICRTNQTLDVAQEEITRPGNHMQSEMAQESVANDDVVDRNEDELHEEANEAHDCETH